MTRLRTPFLLFAAALIGAPLLGACGEDVTEMVVIVDTDFAVPDEMDEVVFRVLDIAEPIEVPLTLDNPDAPAIFPLSLTLVPKDDTSLTFTVQVEGLYAGSRVVERIARVSFVPEQSLSIRMDLRRVCAHSDCSAMGMTCVLGECRDPTDQPTEPFDRQDPTPTEVCNGVDDDGDGETDEPGDDPLALCGAALDCVAGRCEGGGCPGGYANCDDDPDCETHIEEDPYSCGACGNYCPWGCDLGSCADIEQIALGEFHSCVRTSGGLVFCWGDDEYSQLGKGTVGEDRLSPEEVHLEGIRAVFLTAGKKHSCAILEDSTTRCWGYNNAGQTGTPSSDPVSEPVEVAGLVDAVQIAAGRVHTCALRDGGVFCWGDNEIAQLGFPEDVPGTDRPTDPVRADEATGVVPLAGVIAISAEEDHTCALRGAEVVCWGDNTNGELGISEATGPEELARQVFGLPATASAVDAGDAGACALVDGETLRCWGTNVHGEVGNGTLDVPVLTGTVGPGGPFRAVSVGAIHTCAIRGGDNVPVCWGFGGDGDGRLGNRNLEWHYQPDPAPVANASEVRLVAAGGGHTCAIDDTETLYCWGLNDGGQLGDGSLEPSAIPVEVSTPF